MSSRLPYPPDERIRATYHLTCPPDEADAKAEALAREQSVEVPVALTRPPFAPDHVHDHILARVVNVTPLDAINDPQADWEPSDRAGQLHPLPPDHARFVATVDYAAELASQSLPQLLNLLFGNISILQGIQLVDAELPPSLLAAFPGPAFGEAGLRELIGVHGRPLLATAIKPRGAPIDRFADIAQDFSLGGGDLIKDDHNLVHPPSDAGLEAFADRVVATQAAVHAANDQTGRRCLYLPMVAGPHDTLMRQADVAAKIGCAGILVCPLTQGLDAVRALAERRDLVVMTHPTFAGVFHTTPHHGITPAFLLGTLFRLAGADVSVFPNAGGRFGFSQAQCDELADHLARPLGDHRAALPAPAGGMSLDKMPGMCDAYAQQAVLLVGGGLLSLKPSLVDSTRAFADAIAERFPDAEHHAPAPVFVSACEMPPGSIAHEQPSTAASTRPRPDAPHTDTQGDATITHLPFDAEQFAWLGREPIDYKPQGAAEDTPFKDVLRHELFGQNGEPAAFDLRYFQIAPGGYSSLEKHDHVHAIVAVRGLGKLTVNGREHILSPMDLAYVPPMAPHQLLAADANEPFGFFCIVDHTRDRPQPVDQSTTDSPRDRRADTGYGSRRRAAAPRAAGRAEPGQRTP
ncbi:MAG: RuBisCO large subunit C-terminal-like domain-containing protein [Planctomycetota bacterium]